MPLLWAAATILVFLLNGSPPSGLPDEGGVRRTYYVVAHHHYVVSLAAGLAIFGAVYLVLEMLPRVRYRRELGYAHLALAFVGTLLVIAPRIGLNLTAMPRRYADPAATFAFWNTVSLAGYVMTLVGLLLFVVLAVDSVRLTVANKPSMPLGH
jgi:cytochrome c oxidase subunit 1